MKKILILTSSILLSLNMAAQKLYTKTGETNFKASVEAFEAVEAENKSTTVVLNAQIGNIAALLFVKAFHFEVALMEEHFNENYMESDQFPKASFKGKLTDFNQDELSSEKKSYKLEGTLTVRNKTKAISTEAEIYKKGEKVIVSLQFSVQPNEFDIEIPKIVESKIAENIIITGHYELKEKK